MYTNAIANAIHLWLHPKLTLPTDWQRSCVCCEDSVHVSGFLHLLPTTVDWRMLSRPKLPWIGGEFCSVNLLALTDILLLAFSIEQVIIDSSQGYRDNLQWKGHYHLIFLQFHISTWDWANLSSPLFGDLVSRFPRLSKIADNCAEVSLGDLPLPS